jgi:hypothetical protein
MGRVLDGHQGEGMGYIEIKTISNSRQLMDNLGFEGLLHQLRIVWDVWVDFHLIVERS